MSSARNARHTAVRSEGSIFSTLASDEGRGAGGGAGGGAAAAALRCCAINVERETEGPADHTLPGCGRSSSSSATAVLAVSASATAAALADGTAAGAAEENGVEGGAGEADAVEECADD